MIPSNPRGCLSLSTDAAWPSGEPRIDLAIATATDRTAMVYLLADLEARAFVERGRNPEDSRSFLIDLTSAGAATEQQATTALAEQADILLSPLTAPERQQLVALLTRVADHWETLTGDTDAHAARPPQAIQALDHLSAAAEPARKRPPRRNRSS